MISGVTAMRGEVNKMATEDITIDSNIEKQKTILTNTYSNLLKEQKKIKQLKMDIEQYTQKQKTNYYLFLQFKCII